MLAEALAASDEALRVMTLHYAADSVHLAYAHVARGSIHAALRHADAAFADFDRAWQVLRGALGGEAHYVLHVQAQRSAAMVLQGRVKEAQRDLAWIAMRHKALGYPDPANGLLHYATALRVGGDADAALTALAEAAPSVKSPGDRFRWHYERAFAQLERGQAAPALQDFERAAALRDLRSAMTPIRAELAIGHGRALLANGQADQARAHLQAGLDFWLTHEPGSRWVREASAALARGSARSE
jgi:tetratricopeptide (TPR) repeat protein